MNNDLKPIETLKPFTRFLCTIGELPTSYLVSMTYEEQLLWFCNYLEKTVIPTINNNAEAVIELQNYVKNYFDNLDLQDEVSNKLDEMAEDGTLSDLISEAIKFPNSYLTLKKLGRILDETKINNSSASGYYGMQGGCLVDESSYVFISNHFDTSGNYADEYSLIRKISLNTGNILAENTIQIGHGNGIAYDKVNQVYYVACAHGNITSADYENKIIKLDSSLNVLDTYTTLINYDSLCFDEDNNLYGGVTYKGDITNGMKIFKLDKTDFSTIETITLNDPYNSIGTGQDFAIYNNHIYFLQSEPDSILVFDKNGDCISTSLLKNGNVSFIGEVENICSHENGKFVIGSRYQPTGNLYDISQFFEINTLINEIDETNVNREGLRWNTRNVYVNNSVTKWNPDGTSGNPYGCLDEVLNLNYKQPLTIYLVGNNNYNVCRINSFNGEIYAPNNATIGCGNNYNEIVVRESKIYFNSIYELPSFNLEINSDVKFYNSKFTPSNTNQIIYVNKNSICELENCTFNVSSNLTNALFNNVHGILRWNKGNQDLVNLTDVTNYFSGTVEALTPVHLWHGSTAKGNTISTTNIKSFKQLEVDLSDSVKIYMQTRNASVNTVFGNLSTGGTGNNSINNTLITVNNTGLNYEKANRITFDATGAMTVNTSPDIKISDIYGY